MANERETQRAALVCNPVKADAPRLRALVEAKAAAAGWAQPLYFETSVDDPGQGATREALAANADVVLVAGGDGTVRAVSEAIAKSGVPLAIIPSGTGNLLARNLHLPIDSPEPMVTAAFEGDERSIDIGWAMLRRTDGSVDQHAFVIMGGIGVDAHMIANTNPKLKKTIGWLAYVEGAARSVSYAKPWRVMYQVSGRRITNSNVQSIVFANGGLLPAGLELIPEASVSDGALDVAVFQPKGALGWLFVWRRVAWDNSVLRRFRAGRRVLALRTKDNTVRYYRGRGIDIAAREPKPVQLDGDEFGEAAHVAARVGVNELMLVVPTGHSID